MKSLGVTGTVVEDTIDTADGVRTRDLGGIAYALGTLSALLPAEVTIRPVLQVGEDAASTLRTALTALPGVDAKGIVPVAAINNKVHLEYAADGGREETLTGGVPRLPWETLEPWTERLDAWIWNFISGREVDLDTFLRVKEAFGGPLYLDVHSLCLEHVHGRVRRRRPPDRWESWLEGATWVQMNAMEAGLLWTGQPAPIGVGDEAALARRIHDLGADGVLVTRGEEGATWLGADGEIASEPAFGLDDAVDPTGCGDVFGAAWVALRLGHDLAPAEAVKEAVRAAGVAASVRGMRELRAALAAAGGTSAGEAVARKGAVREA